MAQEFGYIEELRLNKLLIKMAKLSAIFHNQITSQCGASENFYKIPSSCSDLLAHVFTKDGDLPVLLTVFGLCSQDRLSPSISHLSIQGDSGLPWM